MGCWCRCVGAGGVCDLAAAKSLELSAAIARAAAFLGRAIRRLSFPRQSVPPPGAVVTGYRMQPQRQLGDDPERSFGANKNEKNRDATWAVLAPDDGSDFSAGRLKVTWRWTSRSFDVVAFCSPDVQAR